MYRVRCSAHRYGNQWLVVRDADQRIVMSGTLYTCLRWVKTWGDTDYAQTRKGQPFVA